MTAADRLAALEQAHAAATPGPWACNDEPEQWMPHEGRIWSETMRATGEFSDEIADTLEHADAAAIVAEHNATPLLIAALRGVQGLHVVITSDVRPGEQFCRECSWGMPWPCPTVRAIDAALGVDSGQQT